MTSDLKSLKRALREQMLARVRAIPAADREASSVTICERVMEMPVWKAAQVVSVFEPLRSEPHIGLLIDNLRRCGREIVTILPTARTHEDVLPMVALDLVLVPGTAFTRDGGRVGYGGGFFDRFLAQRARRAVKVGVCFAVQIVDSLPLAAHDVKMDAVVTD